METKIVKSNNKQSKVLKSLTERTIEEFGQFLKKYGFGRVLAIKYEKTNFGEELVYISKADDFEILNVTDKYTKEILEEILMSLTEN